MQGKGLKGLVRGGVFRARARRIAGARAQGLTCSQCREDREGRERGREERKEDSAHARPAPTSRSSKDRVIAMLRVGPGATAPPVSFVATFSQSLHLVFERRNCRQSRPSAEMRTTLQCKPIHNVACGLVGSSVWDLGLVYPFSARAVILPTPSPSHAHQKFTVK